MNSFHSKTQNQNLISILQLRYYIDELCTQIQDELTKLELWQLRRVFIAILYMVKGWEK